MAHPPTHHDAYFELVRRKRMCGGLAIAIFALLLVSGFTLADARNAGGFSDGLGTVFDLPADVVADTAPKVDELPGHLLRFFPSLVETINIAAMSTLIDAIALSLLTRRGLARWSRAIPVFPRAMDNMRAVPEIVIALVLIFVLGGGPVPAMIAIAFHTAGALGKLFSKVNENANLKPVEGPASVGASWFQKMWFGVVPRADERDVMGHRAVRGGGGDFHPVVRHHRVL